MQRDSPEPVTAATCRDAVEGALLQPRTARKGGQARVNYVPRIIGLVLGFVAVESAFRPLDIATFWWLLLIFHGFVWAHVAHALARMHPDPSRMERWNLRVDSLLGGAWIVLMEFNLLPSAIVLAMMSMHNISSGGMRFFVQGLTAKIIGGLIAGLASGFAWQPETTMSNVVACLPMLLVYPQLVALWTYWLAQRLNEKRQALEQISRHDGLSGVHNRQYWEHLAHAEFSRTTRHGTVASLLLIDIDHFKEFNDRHGHRVGDDVIRRVGRVLREHSRAEDSVGRYGGEEFAVILPDCRSEDALAKAETIREAITQESATYGDITVSIGVAEIDAAMWHYSEWIEAADRALFRAKEAGRNSCTVAVAPERTATTEVHAGSPAGG